MRADDRRTAHPSTAWWGGKRVAEFYRDAAVGGRDGFVVQGDGPANLPDALRRKLVREVAGGAYAVRAG